MNDFNDFVCISPDGHFQREGCTVYVEGGHLNSHHHDNTFVIFSSSLIALVVVLFIVFVCCGNNRN